MWTTDTKDSLVSLVSLKRMKMIAIGQTFVQAVSKETTKCKYGNGNW